jgi:hypothetical protein
MFQDPWDQVEVAELVVNDCAHFGEDLLAGHLPDCGVVGHFPPMTRSVSHSSDRPGERVVAPWPVSGPEALTSARSVPWTGRRMAGQRPRRASGGPGARWSGRELCLLF